MGKAASNWKKPWAEPLRGEARRRRPWPTTKNLKWKDVWSYRTKQHQQTDSDDSSALQTSVVPSATQRGLFISLIWCPPGSSRAGQDNPAQSTNIRGVSLPHKFPSNSSTSASPNGLIHTSQPTTVMHLWGTLGFIMWHPDSMTWFSYCLIRVRSGARGSQIVAAFPTYLVHLLAWRTAGHRNLAWEAVFHRHPETFVIVENWNQLCKD